MARLTKVVFVLLLAMAVTAFATDEKQKRSTACPEGWVKYDGRCFKYQTNKMDWASAEKYCMDLGAHLVSIHDEDEYQKVKSLIRAQDPQENPTWIGFSNCEKNSNWFWSDGTKATFTKWNPDEPNSRPNECCAHMNFPHQFTANKNWNDIPCDLNYPFVCVKCSD